MDGDSVSEFEGVTAERRVYDKDEKVVILVRVRTDKAPTAAEILRAIEFLDDAWDVEEREG